MTRIHRHKIPQRIVKMRPRYQFLPDVEKVQSKAEALLAQLPKGEPKEERTFQQELQMISAITDRYGRISDFMHTDEGQAILAHLLMMEMYLTEQHPLYRDHDHDMMEKGAIHRRGRSLTISNSACCASGRVQ
jgi:hypothetical protein